MEERKLSCDIVKDLLPSYTDELLSDDVKEAVEEHLKECEYCKNAISEYKENRVKELESSIAREEKFVNDARSVKYYLIGIAIGAAIPFLALAILIIIGVVQGSFN